MQAVTPSSGEYVGNFAPERMAAVDRQRVQREHAEWMGTYGQLPPGAALRNGYASWGQRFGAYLVDSLVSFVLVIGAAVMLGGMGVSHTSALLMSLSLPLLYSAAMISSSLQGTLGHLAAGITVCDKQGYRVGIAQALGRSCAKMLEGVLPFMLASAFTIGTSERKQSLHDMIAGTVCVRR
ncbi:MAG: RDD family protein [Thermoleophilia bacterium]|nr:RDD family protein [Thermoleophilia bacterium]